MTKDQMTAIWRTGGVKRPCHLIAWDHHEPKRGRELKPQWDKALLKRAKRDLPNWYAKRNDPWWLA